VEAVGRILGEVLAWLVIALMAILTAVVVVAVVYRKAGASLSWYDEVASVLLVWITYYGAALAALKRSHIGVDNLLLTLPLPARKIAVVLAEFFVILFFVLLAWAGWRVLQVLAGMSLISLTWVPVQFTQSVIPIGAILFIIAEIISLPTYWRDVMAGRSAELAALEPGPGGGG
jgi:TRAP-type C4-dicarboxylate transport system permease small subunit